MLELVFFGFGFFVGAGLMVWAATVRRNERDAEWKALLQSTSETPVQDEPL